MAVRKVLERSPGYLFAGMTEVRSLLPLWRTHGRKVVGFVFLASSLSSTPLTAATARRHAHKNAAPRLSSKREKGLTLKSVSYAEPFYDENRGGLSHP